MLFFVLKIPKAFGVVTGRAQKKAIEEIRTHGYESQSKKKNVVERIQVRNAEMDTGSLKVNKNSEKLTEKEDEETVYVSRIGGAEFAAVVFEKIDPKPFAEKVMEKIGTSVTNVDEGFDINSDCFLRRKVV